MPNWTKAIFDRLTPAALLHWYIEHQDDEFTSGLDLLKGWLLHQGYEIVHTDDYPLVGVGAGVQEDVFPWHDWCRDLMDQLGHRSRTGQLLNSRTILHAIVHVWEMMG